MSELLIAVGGLGMLAATAALWLETTRRIGQRGFAGLLALPMASSVFSVLAWATTAIARIVPLPLTWAFTIALAVIVAARLYRELQVLPAGPR